MSKALNCRGLSEKIDEIKGLRRELTELIESGKGMDGKELQKEMEALVAEVRERLPIDWEKYHRIAEGSIYPTAGQPNTVEQMGNKILVGCGFDMVEFDENLGGQTVISGDRIDKFKVCGTKLYQVRAKTYSIWSEEDGQRLYIVSGRDTDTEDLLKKNRINDFEPTEDGRVFVCRGDGKIEQYIFGWDDPVEVLGENDFLFSHIKMLPDNRLAAWRDDKEPGWLAIIDLKNLPAKEFIRLPKVDSGIQSVAVRDNHLYAVFVEGRIKSWDLRTLEMVDDFDFSDKIPDVDWFWQIEVARDGNVVMRLVRSEIEFEGSDNAEVVYTDELAVADMKNKRIIKLEEFQGETISGMTLTDKDEIVISLMDGRVIKYGLEQNE